MRAGFIGLGHIGRSMALGLIGAHESVSVFDISAEASAALVEAGAIAKASPAEVASASDVIGICVRNDQDVVNVISGPNGIMETATPGLIILVHSTVRPTTVQALAETVAARGVRIVDAPVSRASAMNEPFRAVYMLGGSAQDIAVAREFVAPTAKDIVEAGDVGTAMALKLCNNLVTYLELLAGNEAHRLAIATGLDPALLLKVMIGNGTATISMQSLMRARMDTPGPLEGDLAAYFSPMAALGEKDLDCAIEVANEIGLTLPGAALARGKIRDVFMGAVDGR